MMAAAEARSRGADVQATVTDWLTEEAPLLRGRHVLFTHALSVPAHEPDGASALFLRYVGDRRRLFLVRDPRDTVVSHYFQVTRRARPDPAYVAGSISDFVRDPQRGIDRVLSFLSACDASLREDTGPALLLSYEAVHRDVRGSLAAALAFFDAEVPDDVLEAAVEYGGFENMQRLEREGAFGIEHRRFTSRDPRDPDSFKTRVGKVGSYRDYLSSDDVAYVEERIAATLSVRLGYREPGLAPEAVRSA
jgi:Sulfotransferase domain